MMRPTSLPGGSCSSVASMGIYALPTNSRKFLRQSTTAAQLKEDDEEAYAQISDPRPMFPLSTRSSTANKQATSPTLETPRTSRSQGLRKSRVGPRATGSTGDPFYDDSEWIAELSRQQTLWEDNISDVFDLGYAEAQIVEAGARQGSEALEPREDTQVYLPHDIEHLAEMEHLRDAMGEGSHPNPKPKRSDLRSIPPPHFVEVDRGAADAQEGARPRDLEMHYTYGMSRSRAKIPTRFDWTKRATSRGGKRDKTEITRRTPPLVKPNRANDRWTDPVEAYSEK